MYVCWRHKTGLQSGVAGATDGSKGACLLAAQGSGALLRAAPLAAALQAALPQHSARTFPAGAMGGGGRLMHSTTCHSSLRSWPYSTVASRTAVSKRCFRSSMPFSALTVSTTGASLLSCCAASCSMTTLPQRQPLPGDTTQLLAADAESASSHCLLPPPLSRHLPLQPV